MKYAILLCLIAGLISCNSAVKKEDRQIIKVRKAIVSPSLDGKVTENCWHLNLWHPIDQNWIGNAYSHKDFNGRYKLSWDKDALYLLVEITDDSLYEWHKDPLVRWWDDDSVEVFVDEDNSGGLHQFSNNAFGYNVALDGHIVDMGPDRQPHLLDDHIKSVRATQGKTSIWEMMVNIYPEHYSQGNGVQPVQLEIGKTIGFAVAYCDNDGSQERENFIGSVFIPGEDKNQAWINADIFGTLLLVE